MNYKLTFFTTRGNDQLLGGVQPLQLRVRVLDVNNNPIFVGSPFVVPIYEIQEWYLFGVDIPFTSIPATANSYRVCIEQYEYFQQAQFDFVLDEIHLFRYLPLELTSNLPGNNLQGGLNIGIITANSPQMYTNYLWAGPSGTPVTNTLTNVTVAGIYTCTATDAGGCTRTSTIQLFDLCSPPFPAFTWEISATTGNDNATAVINNLNLGSSIVSTGSVIYIGGTFTIDQNITFVNCPNIFLDANAEIVLLNGATLTLNNCHVSAACSTMWKGILANHVSESIFIQGSTIRDMHWGVDATDGAPIYCQNNLFTDNNIGIRIIKSPAGYNLANNNCIIRNNIFTSTGNPLLSPMQAQSRSEIGIYLEKCLEVEIGMLDYFNVNEKNVFHSLYTGIYIYPPDISSAGTNLKFFNNDFLQINEDIPVTGYDIGTIVSNTYTTRRGAGIYTEPYPTAPAPGYFINNMARVIHVPDGGVFDQCDKAVVLNYFGAEVKDIQTHRTLLGIMCTNTEGLRYEIGNFPAGGQTCTNCTNWFNDVMIGMEFIGNPGISHVNENRIILHTDSYVSGYMGVFDNWARGIVLNNFVNPLTLFEIFNNRIDIEGIGGTGISLNNTGGGTEVVNNEIRMNTTNTVPANIALTADIKGINVINASRTQLRENFIRGFTVNANTLLDVPVFNARLATGIYIHRSLRMLIGCNDIRNCRYGMQVIGDCNTGNTQLVARNRFHNHNFPLLFRHLGSEGTFGNIGNSAYDCANDFIYTPPNNGIPGQVFNANGWRVTRMSLATAFSTDQIWTAIALLDVPESGGNNPATFYNVNDNTGAQIPPNCTVNNPFAPEGQEMDSIDIVRAMEIALDSMIYPEFPEGAEWMDERSLYESLDEDEALRNSSAAFSNFYNAQQAKASDEILAIDRKIRMLNDSTLHDSTLYMQMLAEIESINNSIVPGNVFEANEKSVNGWYLKWLTGGIDSLSENEKMAIETLALSCPFIEGAAVYKARPIYAHLNPGKEYDDLTICNNAGAYKNGNGLFNEENMFLNNLMQLKESKGISVTKENEFLIFPNPTQNQLNISYNIQSDGLCIIFDILGNEKQRVFLTRSANHTASVLSGFVRGLYFCKFMVDNKYQETQKLLVE